MLKLELTGGRAIDVGAGEVTRQQIGRELNAAEIALQHSRQFLDGSGFGKARRSLHHQVTIGEQGDQQTVDQMLLANDPRLQMLAQHVECQMVYLLG